MALYRESKELFCGVALLVKNNEATLFIKERVTSVVFMRLLWNKRDEGFSIKHFAISDSRRGAELLLSHKMGSEKLPQEKRFQLLYGKL